MLVHRRRSSSIIGIALGLLIDWFPVQASTQAKKIDTLWDVLLIVSVPVFVLVETIVALQRLVKFRMRPGEELKDGPPIHGNTRLEIIWTAIPAILLVGLCTYAYMVLTDIEKADGQRAERPRRRRAVHVDLLLQAARTARRSPRRSCTCRSTARSSSRSSPRTCCTTSGCPAFRMKIDAVPGINTHLRRHAEPLGNYPVVCAELCGLGHSVMRQTRARRVAGRRSTSGSRQPAARPAAAGGAAAAAAAAARRPDGKTLFTRRRAAARPATRSPTRAPPARRPGPGQGRSRARTRPSSSSRSRTRTPRSRRAIQRGIMPPNFGQTLQPAQIDALVKYLSEVTK